MPRVVGIDPGTLSLDLCGLDGGQLFLAQSIPSDEFARRPETLLDALREAAPLDLIAGPSGYGLPLVPIEAVGERELRLIALAEAGEGAGIGGLRTLVGLLREARLPVVFTPGVIHLSTVPAHRKVNRVDLGTADKLCAAALAIDAQARRLGIPYAETAFVLVELGGAFTAIVSVEDGRIVSGQGGSSGPLGYRAAGALDAEAAFLLGTVSKSSVFSGGAAFIAGAKDAAPEALTERTDAAAGLALAALIESIVKAVAAERAIVPRARDILLSGRLAKIPRFRKPLAEALSRFGRVTDLAPRAPVKEAAMGAALLADGLAGGSYAPLVEALRLREACGTALDHLYLEGADAVRAWALRES